VLVLCSQEEGGWVCVGGGGSSKEEHHLAQWTPAREDMARMANRCLRHPCPQVRRIISYRAQEAMRTPAAKVYRRSSTFSLDDVVQSTAPGPTVTEPQDPSDWPSRHAVFFATSLPVLGGVRDRNHQVGRELFPSQAVLHIQGVVEIADGMDQTASKQTVWYK